jgi:hypothetical protein
VVCLACFGRFRPCLANRIGCRGLFRFLLDDYAFDVDVILLFVDGFASNGWWLGFLCKTCLCFLRMAVFAASQACLFALLKLFLLV